MARSLTVKHEEHVGNAWLLNGFLLFAAAWMLLGALTWSSSEAFEPSATDAIGY